MSFQTHIVPLSALSPIRFTYEFKSKEPLHSKYKVLDNGVRFLEHELLNKSSDSVFSQNNAIVLTEIKDLKQIFEEKTEQLNVRYISACFYLSFPDNIHLVGNTTVKKLNKRFFVGGSGQEAIFNIIPLGNNLIELKTEQKNLAISENYPYDLILLDEPLQENVFRQQFEIDVFENKFTLKTKTNEGYRYLSYSKVDRALRATGVQLNATTINQYLLEPIFVSKDHISHNFDPTIKEVRYFNQVETTPELKNLNLKTQKQADTNLTISCSLDELITEKEVNVNIAIMKTNFATNGTFNTSL